LADLEQAREWLAQATRVAVLTGAGISAESGVPTFRGDGGLWKEYKAEDLATPEAFLKDPRLVWEWYNWRRELVAKALPNAAHKALVQLEIKKREYTLITQNVDGLHDRAGSGHAQAARRHLAHAVHGVRRQLAGPARAVAQSPAPLRLRRSGSPRRGLVRRAAS